MVISELKQLEVVNLTDGKILGNVSDIMVNLAKEELRPSLYLEMVGSGFL